MTIDIPAWDKVSAGEPAPTIPFALILDGVVQQIMNTNVTTASLLLENPQIIRTNDYTVVGDTADSAVFVQPA
jgi:hypothetical protein